MSKRHCSPPASKCGISVRFPVGHYRVPNYIRGKLGMIEQVIAPRAVNNEEEGFGRTRDRRGSTTASQSRWPRYGRAMPERRKTDCASRFSRHGWSELKLCIRHEHDHDHADLSLPAAEAPGYYEMMETAVRELLVERRLIESWRDPPADRGAGFAHAGARCESGRARLGRSGLSGAPSGQRALRLRGARHQLLRRHAADRPREYRRRFITSSSAPCARAIHGRCSGCRPTGTS